jgi:hypothetical protein
MLQVIHLDVMKVDFSVAHVIVGPICNSHLLQGAAAGPACMRMGVEGAPRCMRGTQSGAGAGHGVARYPT